MEAAYGLAITVTMLMTTVLLTFYLRFRGVNRWLCGMFLLFFASLEGVFFAANLFKFTHGGWFAMLVAGMVVFVMIVWRNSTRIRNSYNTSLWPDISTLLPIYGATPIFRNMLQI